MELLVAGHPSAPALDMALSHALLLAVARGERPETARIFRPGATIAFGRLDELRDGYPAARAAAAARGWRPVMRLGGGRAAGYDGGSVVVELVTRSARVAEGLQERFAAGVDLLVAGLADAGVETAVGELRGEYCPGRWSVHLPGGPKVAGAAQRSIRGASLFTAAVVVEGGDRLRDALVAVYAALDLDWDPATAGAAEDAVAGVTAAAVAAALTTRLAERAGPLAPAVVDPALLATAQRLLPQHAR